MTEIKECPICGSQNLAYFLTCLDHTVSHQTFPLSRCEKCNLVITTPRPDDSELGRYYLSQAYTSHISKARTTLDSIYLLARSFTLRWKLSIVEKNSSTPTIKTLLDYGCGTGEFIKAAIAQTWNTTGVEPSAVARDQASNDVRKQIYQSLQDIPTDKKFDAITLWHVLEHIPDLDSTIQKLKNLLTVNGTIFIAVPNHGSWDGETYKSHWAGFDVPRHLWHFSKDNMKMLLEKNGMKLLNTIPMRLDAFYICLLSEQYKANRVNTVAAFFKAFINGFLSNLHGHKTREYSSHIYIAKK